MNTRARAPPRRRSATSSTTGSCRAIFTGNSGNRYDLGLQLPDQRREREPDGLAGLRRPDRLRRRSRCRLLRRPVPRSSTSRAVTAPSYGSVGLESGRNLMIQCAEQDPRPLPGAHDPPGRQPPAPVPSRRVQRVQHRRSTTAATPRIILTTPTNLTVRERAVHCRTARSPPNRLLPRNAGFGAATGAQNMRNFQAMIRFQF